MFRIVCQGTVSPVWEQMCVQTFHNSAPGAELDACLWSLTEVLKRLLRGAHQGKNQLVCALTVSAETAQWQPSSADVWTRNNPGSHSWTSCSSASRNLDILCFLFPCSKTVRLCIVIVAVSQNQDMAVWVTHIVTDYCISANINYFTFTGHM